MVKYIVGMKRSKTMPLDELNEKWESILARRAVKTPGLRKYNVNFAVDGWPDALDGFGEIWFDNLTEARHGLASFEFTETRYFIRDYGVYIPLRILGEDRIFPVSQSNNEVKFRYINYLKKPVNMYIKPMMHKIWLEQVAPLAVKVPGITKYVASLGVDDWVDSADGLEEYWFDTLEAAQKAVTSPEFIETRRALLTYAIMPLGRNIVEAHKVV
jgi:hypothetical protein